jgi:hypothetical protein
MQPERKKRFSSHSQDGTADLESDQHLKLARTPDPWSASRWVVAGYVRDVLIILVIALGALYLSEHPEKFDAFMNWLIGYRYKH